MLYLASKVSSARFSWRQRLSVPRPFIMMTREEMPLRYPTRAPRWRGKPKSRVMRLWTPPMPPVPPQESCVERCVRRCRWCEGQGAAHGLRKTVILAGTSPKVGGLKEQGGERHFLEARRRATGPGAFFLLFFIFRSVFFRVLFFLLHDRDAFCLFNTHSHTLTHARTTQTHTTNPPGQGLLASYYEYF